MELTKLEEAREMSMISKGYKNYYIVEVPNKKSNIYDLITKCFKVNDVISIQYNRKINKEASQALLAVESPTQENVENSIELMKEMNYKYEIINDRGELLDLFF
jgi:methylaspartate ammonia-lyase